MNRRQFLTMGTTAAVAIMAGTAFRSQRDEADEKGRSDAKENDVSPAEDLMREHGVLKRVLLVYREAVRRIDAGEDFPPEPLTDAARLIREFVEDYHEKLEENFVFPRFRRAGVHEDLVEVLLQQHQAGRKLTDHILVQLKELPRGARPRGLSDAMQKFVRMYEPHEAREDTVLFPALRRIVSANEYDSLGEDFEKKENELFGNDGFTRMVDRVAGIEKQFGIYDLGLFTPK